MDQKEDNPEEIFPQPDHEARAEAFITAVEKLREEYQKSYPALKVLIQNSTDDAIFTGDSVAELSRKEHDTAGEKSGEEWARKAEIESASQTTVFAGVEDMQREVVVEVSNAIKTLASLPKYNAHIRDGSDTGVKPSTLVPFVSNMLGHPPPDKIPFVQSALYDFSRIPK